MNRGPIPGTHEPGFVEQRIVQQPVAVLRTGLAQVFEMGECGILLSRDAAGPGGRRLWHLSISCADRHPTWDEIKTARYRLLPDDLTFGMLLPPPDDYVNVTIQDHVFHLWEVDDPREPT